MFLSGEISHNINVTIQGDNAYELNETFYITLANISSSAIAGSTNGTDIDVDIDIITAKQTQY